ncbi:hypothetical protein RHMOL_Rhmol11G0106200 [Rhododendron molle]|uniref:Uncharacterized protein n=1 Tax=Rhododendron molle TaxID=49168 RepID=A0ACC0LQQ8_RHOML|nr:hypothetical protein RHMOL_Rhmol11G0106200 [Rhododendron molle]
MISNNSFTGNLPSELGWNLSRLEISDYKFSGQIPSAVSSWVRLVVFMASNNQLSGKIPVGLTSLSQLITLNLAGNSLTGDFPATILSWENLNILNLSRNRLSCPIPAVIGTLPHLDLSENQFFGQIPAELSQLRKLDNKLEKEFSAEVDILGTIRHCNIVKLLCCISSEDSKLLVYEYLENQNLDKWLHVKKRRETDPALRVVLDWPKRLEIVIGAAQGLCYMHHDCTPRIIHRDVKSSNILLDSEFKARMADFGLAKILAKRNELNTMSIVVGSFGYMAQGSEVKKVGTEYDATPLLARANKYLSSYMRSKTVTNEDGDYVV